MFMCGRISDHCEDREACSTPFVKRRLQQRSDGKHNYMGIYRDTRCTVGDRDKEELAKGQYGDSKE